MLLMLFATSGYASIPLTPSMWHGDTNGFAHALFTSTDLFYGLGTPTQGTYADLSNYSKLVLTVPEGSPRAFFNKGETTHGNSDNNTRIENPYMTKSGNVYTYDLEALVALDGKAHLNSIKSAAYGVNGECTSMQLVEKVSVSNTIYFSDVSIGGEGGKQSNFRKNILSVTPHNLNEPTSFKFVLKDANGQNTITTPVDPSNFEISSSDANVIDVSSRSVSQMSSGNYKYEITGVKLNPGTAYLTVRYGNITETHPINIAKVPVEIFGKADNVYTKHLGDGTWSLNFGVSLIGQESPLNVNSTSYFSSSSFKLNSGAVSIPTNLSISDNYYVNDFTVQNIGTEIIHIVFKNHPIYEDCEADFPISVLKGEQKLRFHSHKYNYKFENGVDNVPASFKSQNGSYNNLDDNLRPSNNPVTYTSSDPNVLTVDANGHLRWTGNAGKAIITAHVDGNDQYAPASDSFTFTVQGDQDGPRLIWLTFFKDGKFDKDNRIKSGRGSTYGYSWTESKTDYTYTIVDGVEQKVPVTLTEEKANRVPYNDNTYFQAIALKSNVTDEVLRGLGLKEFPYKKDVHDYWYWVEPDGVKGDARYFLSSPIADYLYGDSQDPVVNNKTHNSQIVYSIDTELKPGYTYWNTTYWGAEKDDVNQTSGSPSADVAYNDATPHWYGNSTNQANYGVRLHIGATYGDSLTVTATYPGKGRVNPSSIYNKFWVESKDFGFEFQPKEGVVNEDNWIIPYVKFPDLKLEDFSKIWVTIDNSLAVAVEGADDMYTRPINGIDNSWTEAQLKQNLGGYFDYFKFKKDDNRGWLIEGIYPKIWGLTAGEEADVTIHIEGYGGTFTNAEATYHVTVVKDNGDLFHWEMNDVAGHDDKKIKTITMIEGDYIYMPGIVGNPNGNDEYSKEGSYKYLYSIQEGNIVMNFKPYFWREGIPNYFFTYANGIDDNTNNDSESYSGKKPAGERLIPTTHTNKQDAPEALIFWASGLGNYYRNDSLLIYANKPTGANQGLLLWAEDPQTHHCCTPIKLVIVPRQTLYSQRDNALQDMTYPFTWDFEHMHVTDYELIKQDARNGNYTDGSGHPYTGNGGSYWRKRWDSGGSSVLRTAHDVNKDYYQYNGVFNADYDDKDNNYNSGQGQDEEYKMPITGTRQRWFKDLSANGTYLNLFKGLRLNIAGLDYWQQKYTRFNVSTKPYGGIYFEGGVHYLSLPGFGINGSAVIFDATREKGTLPMPGSQVHFNTEEHNCTPGYFDRWYEDNIDNYYHNGIFDNSSYIVNGNSIKKNRRVYFVIKARGNSNRSIIYVGGKKMMVRTNTNSYQDGIGTGTGVGENGTLYSTTNEITENNAGLPTNTQRILLADAVDKPKVYAIPLDPWDEDFQEQIYLAFNNGVHVYWMGITTEPRYLRDDYETYTYSYPVDLDIDRTNQVMDILTEERFGEGNTVNMVPYYGTGYQHASKSLVVDRLLSDETETRAEGDKALEAEELVNYKIPANEGIVLYPTKRLHDIKKAIGDAAYEAGTEEGTVPGKTVISVLYDENNKPMTDNTGKILYKSMQYDYKYRYLPTYFIANARNMHKDAYTADAGGRGKGTTIIDRNKALSNSDPNKIPDMTTRTFVYTDGQERTNVPSYNMANRLTSSPYSTYIFKDYYSTNGQMPTSTNNGISHKSDPDYYHFIALGMTNEYNKRYLDYNEDYDVYKELKDYMHDAQGNQLTPGDPTTTPNDPTTGEFDHVDTKQFYYNLIGPAAVKFYRAGNDNWARGRRSYMKLTWEEYEVNTVGKIIYSSSDNASPGEEYYEYVPETSGPNGGDIQSGGPQPSTSRSNYTGVKLIFKTNGGNNTNEEELVSEDGGFPDGIEEVKQDTGNGAFYNLNGTRVTTPRKGVYIHNGKKVIIK